MKIALIGATGTIGQRILLEALSRGHQVTVIARDPARVQEAKNVQVAIGDVFKPESIARAAAGHDAVISAYGPKHGEESSLLTATESLIEGVKQSGVRRFLTVGGAGSLEVAPGVHLVDTPEFPDAWKPIALAHRDALELYRQETELDWTYLSPAALIEPGERTGQFRTGTDQLITDKNGDSRISAEDFAVALLDELENPRFIRQRFTVAY
ncbi:NAD(P)-dependent oxidoreductase [Salinithrix halophila]|uniref:NAD(P)-dependent oxidoreductase n=1 Tax=Salinithrix halophila TaxID=1485204 RepID=A0ABV8JF28_9BACL